MRVSFQIPPSLNSFQRESLAQEIIQRIKDRTDSGLDINNRPFAPYSESYVASLDFRIAGKSESQVNLRLSDEMMDSIQLISHATGFITIGLEGSAAQKAEWNAASDNGPSREFLGLSEDELADLTASYVEEPPDSREEGARLIDNVLNNARLNLFRGEE